MAEAAYYRFESKIVTRGKGHSAVAAAAYNAAEKLQDELTGTHYNFTRKQHVYHTEILAPANAPAWVYDRHRLWNQAEKSEKRNDAQVSRHFILSLPNFLPHEEKIAVTRRFLQRECVAKGMVADVCFHDFDGDKRDNPHAHVLLTMREMEPDGFAAKKNRQWNKKEQLQEWREKWAQYLNTHLEQGGYDKQVDHRSYEARGIDRQPGIHEGRAVTAIREQIARGERTETTSAMDFNAKVKEYNALRSEIEQLQRELAQEDRLRAQETATVPPKTPEQDNQKITTIAQETAALQVPGDKGEAATLRQQAQQDYARVTAEIVETASRPSPPATSHSMAAPARTPTKPVSKDGGNPPREPEDRTYQAVKRQLLAMGGDGNFEIGIGNDDKGYFKEKTLHRDRILRVDPNTNKAPFITYLKGENARGSHIYIRPAPHSNGDSQGLVLVDDLDPVMVDELKDKGLQPSLVVETSHKNCQAWVRISDRLSREEATQLAKLLAREAGGDPASASYQHYGRLAGFTNRKDKHQDIYSGRYPWVLVRSAKPQQADLAEQFLELARQVVAEEKAKRASALKKREELLNHQATSEELAKAQKTFMQISTSVERKYGINDPSRRDWAVLKRMAKRGYSLEAMEYALSHCADVGDRKKGHEEDYIRRTIEKISQDSDVLMALERRQQRQRPAAPSRQPQPSQTSKSLQPSQPSPPSSAAKPPHGTERQSGDERKLIEQWQFYKDRERGSEASMQQATKQPVERPPESSPGRQNTRIRLSQYRVGDIPQETFGDLDTDAVRYIIEQTLQSEEAQRLMDKSSWALEQDTSRWKMRIKAEYLKERGRMLRFRPYYAISPASDAEIAYKLRLAGFSRKSIAQVICSESPFYRALAKEKYRQVYLEKGIAASVYHPRLYGKVREFQQRRMEQALTLPKGQRDFFMKENRLDKLNLHSRADDMPTKPAKKSGGSKKSSPKPRGAKNYNQNKDIERER